MEIVEVVSRSPQEATNAGCSSPENTFPPASMARNGEDDQDMTGIDSKLYGAAGNGEVSEFEEMAKTPGSFKHLLTPSKNTILHIYTTAAHCTYTRDLWQAITSGSRLTRSQIRSKHDGNKYIDQISLMRTENHATDQWHYTDPFPLQYGHYSSDFPLKYPLEYITTEVFVNYVLDKCLELAWQPNAKGDTPLHMAARFGNYHIADILISRAQGPREQDVENGIGAAKVLIRATNHDDDTPLHEAVRHGHIELVDLLTKKDPDYRYSFNKAGETPLYLAAERPGKESHFAIKILENCKSLACDGPRGRTALHAAVISKNKEIAKRLLEAKHLSGLAKQADINGRVPLHYAAEDGCVDLAKLLIQHGRKTAYERDSDGKTALHIAAYGGHIEIMEEIILCCPDCSELVDKEGFNVLHYAIRGGSEPAATLICNNPSFSNLYNEKDFRGNSPLHHLALSARRMGKIGNNKRVHKMAFNNKHQTALDVASMNLNLAILNDSFIGEKEYLPEWLLQIGTRPGRRIINKDINYQGEDDASKSLLMSESKKFIKAKDSHLVVATLIATVTFAAGFTLPGGTVQDGDNLGSAILKKRSAFTSFVIADATAMVLSGSAVFIHLFLVTVDGKPAAIKYLRVAFLLTVLAMGAMIIAFVAGTLAVLGGSSGVGVATFLIGFSFFLTFFISFKMAFGRTLPSSQKEAGFECSDFEERNLYRVL